jgi:hypothetical protein
MAEDMSAHLEIIKEQTKKLNTAADSIAKAIRDLNERLGAMNVGVTTYYTDAFFEAPADAATGDLQACRYYIGYDRDQDGAWGVSIMCRSHVIDAEMMPEKIKARKTALASKVNSVRWIRSFDKCPRNVRLALCQYIPEVVKGLAASVSNMADSIGKSLQEIQSIQSLNATKEH